MGCRRLGDPEHGVEIGLQGGVELLRRDVADRLLADLLAGVVDEDVDAAQFLDRRLDEVLAEGRLLDVARNGHGLSTFGFDQRNHLLGVGRFARQIDNGHVGPLPRVGDRGGASDIRGW